MVSVFYSPVYVGSAHVFETTRKAQWIADSLGSVPIGGIELVSPSSLSYDQLVQVHDPAYVRAVETGVPRSLAESQGFRWDAGLWPMVCASNGGAVAAGAGRAPGWRCRLTFQRSAPCTSGARGRLLHLQRPGDCGA